MKTIKRKNGASIIRRKSRNPKEKPTEVNFYQGHKKIKINWDKLAYENLREEHNKLEAENENLKELIIRAMKD